VASGLISIRQALSSIHRPEAAQIMPGSFGIDSDLWHEFLGVYRADH
jgi:hypothetical protein